MVFLASRRRTVRPDFTMERPFSLWALHELSTEHNRKSEIVSELNK
jgi:hypothetical protein